jgi:glucosyl-3-phosphoglycerate synthase
MISVIIPTIDVSATISAVVKLALADLRVSEVIVVDDGSIDGTPELAIAAGAHIIASTLLGKGASMRDGLNAARNELLIYLDGDLNELRQDSISRLAGPLIDGAADFVKASFSREAGRVTALTARPLLQTFFPEVNHIEQPLGGIIAARRSLLQRLRFEDDYGVDVGLLLDAARLGSKLAQVYIGHIEHDSQPFRRWERWPRRSCESFSTGLRATDA